MEKRKYSIPKLHIHIVELKCENVTGLKKRDVKKLVKTLGEKRKRSPQNAKSCQFLMGDPIKFVRRLAGIKVGLSGHKSQDL